jgi:hypothetical protein
MLTVCHHLLLINHSFVCQIFIIHCAKHILIITTCFLRLFFGTENDELGSLPNNTINKGRLMPEDHKIFMEEYEKYGNNCTLIAKVLYTQTPVQIKKHADCFF